MYTEYTDLLAVFALIGKIGDICALYGLAPIPKVDAENKPSISVASLLPTFIPFVLDHSSEFFSSASKVLTFLSSMLFTLPAAVPKIVATSLSYALLSFLRLIRLNLEYLSATQVTAAANGFTLNTRNEINSAIQQLLGWVDGPADNEKIQTTPLNPICNIALNQSIRGVALEIALIISLEFVDFLR
jgi:hypothetical protein